MSDILMEPPAKIKHPKHELRVFIKDYKDFIIFECTSLKTSSPQHRAKLNIDIMWAMFYKVYLFQKQTKR